MENLEFGVEMLITIRHIQFQLHLNRAWQAATEQSDADQYRAKEQIEHTRDFLLLVQFKLFENLLPHNE